MKTSEIRQRFLDYFAKNEHPIIPSASLISPDPSTLFTIAGMVPFIPYFTGEQTPPWPKHRAASVQKCVRTADIDEVGKTTRHGTFFQMNGNFSFGDYFKAEAIKYAWELVTGKKSEGNLEFNPDDIWVTVYEEDDEAYSLWQEIAGIDKDRIQRRGKSDNYWSTGLPGPAGPSSEIFIDRGKEFGKDGGPIADEERYMEIWNLVFTEFEIANVKSKYEFDVVGKLKNKNIDTGMGLERVAYLMQQKDNMYEIDEVFPVIEKLEEITGKRYGTVALGEDNVRMRILADHIRSALMIIGDGVTPSNEGRGYVLRRLLRRSVRALRLLGVHDKVMNQLLFASKEVMKLSYPELECDYARIDAVVQREEDVFSRTLSQGITILDTALDKAAKSEKKSLSGKDAFKLHDTFGFPIDLTLEIAHEQGVSVDEKAFKDLMLEQKQRAREDALKKRGATDLKVYNDLKKELSAPNEFIGYTNDAAKVRVLGIIAKDGAKQFVEAPQDVQLVLDKTPFYAESGGQLPDHGSIVFDSGAVLDVYNVQKPVAGLIVHMARLVEGRISLDEIGTASIDVTRRHAIARAHTSAHMIHKAMQEELGSDATQAGSENSPNRVRFDFRIDSRIPAGVLSAVEGRVNEKIRENNGVKDRWMSIEEAKGEGAMALFGEKYGDRVRVVTIGDDAWSKELCVGTHVASSGDIGMVTLLGESSLSAGVRRVDALVGKGAVDHNAKQRALVNQLTGLLGVPDDQIRDRIENMMSKIKDQEKKLESIQKQALISSIPAILSAQKDVDGVTVIEHNAGDSTPDATRQLALELRARLGNAKPCVIAIASTQSPKVAFIVATNEPAREKGIAAGNLVRTASKILGGGGGGKPDFAQGGGTNGDAIPQAFESVEQGILG
jgi:alanyl-tRNA synthetase